MSLGDFWIKCKLLLSSFYDISLKCERQKELFHWNKVLCTAGSLSSAGAATSIIFVATNDVFCRDKHVFVATKLCRDKKIILVAALANDRSMQRGTGGGGGGGIKYGERFLSFCHIKKIKK